MFLLEAVAQTSLDGPLTCISSLQTRDFGFIFLHARCVTMLLDLSLQDPNVGKIGTREYQRLALVGQAGGGNGRSSIMPEMSSSPVGSSTTRGNYGKDDPSPQVPRPSPRRYLDNLTINRYQQDALRGSLKVETRLS